MAATSVPFLIMIAPVLSRWMKRTVGPAVATPQTARTSGPRDALSPTRMAAPAGRRLRPGIRPIGLAIPACSTSPHPAHEPIALRAHRRPMAGGPVDVILVSAGSRGRCNSCRHDPFPWSRYLGGLVLGAARSAGAGLVPGPWFLPPGAAEAPGSGPARQGRRAAVPQAALRPEGRPRTMRGTRPVMSGGRRPPPLPLLPLAFR